MAGPIRIAILANGSQARRELDKTASTAERIGGRFSRFRVPAAAALAAIGLGAKKAVSAASDLNEETSKTDQIFGRQSGTIRKWAAGAATSIGQSKRAAMQAAGTFGLIGQKAGLSGRETARFATKFTGLASDLASFNNTTPEAAVEAIGAAMRGESEPIRKYGVLLDDATLRARALKMGLIRTTKQALTPQQKALAASREILAQTTKAQGDFARTSDGAANRQRIVAAQVENLSAQLGQGLLPAYSAVLGILSKVTAAMSAHPTATKAVVIAVAGLAAAMLALSAAQKIADAATTAHMLVQKAAAAATKAWAVAQWALNVAMSANPIALVVLAIVALVAAVVIAYKRSEKFRAIVNKAFSKVKAVVVAVVNAVKGAITGTWSKIVSVTRTVWGAILSTIRARINLVRAVVSAVVRVVRTVVATAWQAVTGKTREAWQAVVSVIRDKIGAFMTLVRGIRDKVLGALSGAATWLWDAGKRIIQGLLDGIASMIGKVRDKLAELTNLIPDWKGPAARDKRLLYKSGKLIMGGLVAGWDSMLPTVRRKLGGITSEIRRFDATLGGDHGLTATVALAGTGAGTSGATTYNINVTAPVGASSADIGRDLARHLDAYARVGGRRRV